MFRNSLRTKPGTYASAQRKSNGATHAKGRDVPRYAALLRGINVGGHRVKMDRLRGIFEEFGFAEVTTFIASGNVIFRRPSDDAVALERQIEQHLERE